MLQFSKFLKCMVNYKPHKKHMYKTKKINILSGSRFMV